MSKLKTRHVKRMKRGKRSRCGGKYSKRKGYNKKHYTRKNKKYIKNQKRLRRQTRKKVGGFKFFSSRPKILPSLSDRPFNFVLPETITDKNNINIQGFGWAYVTRLNRRTSMSDRPEQIIIYKILNEERNVTGNYFIARCPYTQCNINDRDNMREKNMKPLLQTENFRFKVDKYGVYTFTTTDEIEYRIKPGGSSLQEFFTLYINSLTLEQPDAVDVSPDAGAVEQLYAADDHDLTGAQRLARYVNQQQLQQQQLQQQQELQKYARPVQGNTSEKVKIKGAFRNTDANASIYTTGKTDDPNTRYREDIYTLFINDKEKIKFLLKRNNGFSYDDKNDTKIDGKCYRLYKFTDMDNESNSIEIYVPVSRTIGSIFHTLQPELAGDQAIDIDDLCD